MFLSLLLKCHYYLSWRVIILWNTEVLPCDRQPRSLRSNSPYCCNVWSHIYWGPKMSRPNTNVRCNNIKCHIILGTCSDQTVNFIIRIYVYTTGQSCVPYSCQDQLILIPHWYLFLDSQDLTCAPLYSLCHMGISLCTNLTLPHVLQYIEMTTHDGMTEPRNDRSRFA